MLDIGIGFGTPCCGGNGRDNGGSLASPVHKLRCCEMNLEFVFNICPFLDRTMSAAVRYLSNRVRNLAGSLSGNVRWEFHYIPDMCS